MQLLEVSGAVRLIYGSLGFKRLIKYPLVTKLRKLDIVRMLTASSLVTRPDALYGKWGKIFDEIVQVSFLLFQKWNSRDEVR